ncbi:hypothetical protein EUX98_g9076 [Antrodiella citrinella]|uniref:DRBM domain-containing protein n=1 Tax=Antrodiella citrinella TaxID=2447956 RepID=A0A4S4M0P9_9APHY|nr:hypothetical protein EUX98_g9076 [Antrodiella citrinella]
MWALGFIVLVNRDMSNTDGTVLLNNLLQKLDKLSLLSWEDTDTGPAHAPEWHSTCKLDGDVIGTGSSSTKAAAKDAAAKEALKKLNQPTPSDDTSSSDNISPSEDTSSGPSNDISP